MSRKITDDGEGMILVRLCTIYCIGLYCNEQEGRQDEFNVLRMGCWLLLVHSKLGQFCSFLCLCRGRVIRFHSVIRVRWRYVFLLNLQIW